MFWKNWGKLARKFISQSNIDISINRTVTINGKTHKCKTDPCPVCSEIDKAMDHVSKAMDSVGEAVDKVSKAVKDES